MNFPVSTVYGKRVPKKTFADKLKLNSPIRKSIQDDIQTIRWTYTLKEATLNLPAGKDVHEIEVLEMKLKHNSINEKVLQQFDRQIPYHLLFVLQYEEKVQAWMSYKEAASANQAFRVEKYYHTKWMRPEELNFQIEGTNFDEVYESLARQIAGEKLQSIATGESLKKSIERNEEIIALEKETESLQQKLKKEKQFNRKMEINQKIKQCKNKIEDMLNG